MPKFPSKEDSGNIEDVGSMQTRTMSTKHLDIDDDPTEDLVCRLKDACDWIDAALKTTTKEDGDEMQTGVLVHCTQGMSRSGSIAVAYGTFLSATDTRLSFAFCPLLNSQHSHKAPAVMRTLSVPYADALSLVRESRPIVTPNIGFARQLKVWEECRYEIFIHDTEKEKTPYRLWKKERDELLGRGEEAVNRARVSAMGSMAAGFGQMRLKKAGERDKETEALRETKTK
jgi:dual specificity phosphatase 12